MQIEINEQEPLETFKYSVLAEGKRNTPGSNRQLEIIDLPILLGEVKGLNCDLEAIIIASDLQGNVIENNIPTLVGELLPDFLKLLFEVDLPDINIDKVGVFLCGDLYARTDKRGGTGDVKNVWRAFNQNFAFVAGVAGNHDDFGSQEAFDAFKSEKGIHYLNHEVKKIAGLRIGGLCGIIGKPTKPFRVEVSNYLSSLKKLLQRQPDFLLLHEGPNDESLKLKGNPKIGEVVDHSRSNTICCGHNHWPATLVHRKNGTQVLNLDSKCLVLRVV